MAKDRVARISYLNSDGEKVTSPFEAEGIRWEFFDPNAKRPDGEEKWEPPVAETVTYMFDDLRKEAQAAGVDFDACALAYGVKQIGSDGYAGRKQKGEAPWDMLEERMQDVLSGEYRSGAGEKRGASKTLLAEAVKRAIESQGTEVDADMFARITESLATEEAREAAKAQPKIAAAYEAIKAERAQERARKKAEAAAQSDDLDLAAFGVE